MLFDAHHDDPEFGHRLLADEAARAGLRSCDRRVWRICRDNQWWSVFGKKRAKNGKKPGPPAHDDHVRRQFRAERPNQLWLWDITEHPTAWMPAIVATGSSMRYRVKQPFARLGCPSRGLCGADR